MSRLYLFTLLSRTSAPAGVNTSKMPERLPEALFEGFNVKAVYIRRFKRLLLTVLGLSAATLLANALLAAGGPPQELSSVWRAEPVLVDEHVSEWSGALAGVAGKPISLGVANDGEFLYVAIATSDPGVRQMLGRTGFTVWIDPDGKERSVFGIALPPVWAMPNRGRAPAENAEDRPPAPALEPWTYLEIREGKKDRHRIELVYLARGGIAAAVDQPEGTLVYEIKMPLARSDTRPYAAGVKPGALVGLGVETEKLDRAGQRPGGGRDGRGGAGGGMGGSGGGRGGMGGASGRAMGGGADSMNGKPPQPIKFWVRVRLSQGS